MRNEIRKEVIGIILLALGIISALLLYLPQDITGILGSLVNKTIFGLVGTCAVVVPFFLLYNLNVRVFCCKYQLIPF